MAKHSAACQPGRETGKEAKYSSFEAYKMTLNPLRWRDGGKGVEWYRNVFVPGGYGV